MRGFGGLALACMRWVVSASVAVPGTLRAGWHHVGPPSSLAVWLVWLRVRVACSPLGVRLRFAALPILYRIVPFI
ncbi:hypothetical protein B0H13DRAFT_2018182 [Mycena leptocephala]|nr:hypothetical protein B0H13DRAFT_2018182 [Mycena leptocephala]